MHSLGSISKNIEPTRLVSATNQNRAPSGLGSQSESSITSSGSSAIRIEFYVYRELSARVEDPSRLSTRVGSL